MEDRRKKLMRVLSHLRAPRKVVPGDDVLQSRWLELQLIPFEPHGHLPLPNRTPLNIYHAARALILAHDHSDEAQFAVEDRLTMREPIGSD